MVSGMDRLLVPTVMKSDDASTLGMPSFEAYYDGLEVMVIP